MSRRRRPCDSLAAPSHLRELDVSPLVDISFLLLIFFLVTSTLKKAEADLPTRLPGEGVPAGMTPLLVEIDADADGRVALDDTLVETDPDRRRLASLIAELERSKGLAMASGSTIMAMIDIEDGASQQRFADLLNALAAAGIEDVSIAHSP